MGSAFVSGILSKDVISKKNIYIVEPSLGIRRKLMGNGLTVFGSLNKINITKLNINTVLLAVKPQIVNQVLMDLKTIINNEISLISIVAGKNIEFYEKKLGIKNIIRAMPNTPARIGKGVTAIYAKPNVCLLYTSDAADE